MRGKKVEDFAVSCFSPHLYRSYGCQLAGCGATALSLILKIHPFKIKNTNKKNRHDWTDSFMVGFLKRNGWQILKLDERTVTSYDSISNPVGDKHILLVSQRYSKTDSSWAVVFDELYIHNFQISHLDVREFINRPIISIYCIKPDEIKNK